ncbi:uncharacterized protein LOC111294351 [Durio zibethinus]|uniref:Uncharacterized protein LOC111294351 n=1 Tax=Durio zibethinus TaxID=66656 RepID=A0A6P5YS41_DURZI|nr:uncharacterized protein LOC111294351 [Durio zibethinus]
MEDLKQTMEENLKQTMEEFSQAIQPSLNDCLQAFSTCPEDDQVCWRSISQSLQHWDEGSIPIWAQSNSQPGINNRVVPNQTNVSTAQASRPTNISNSPLLQRSLSTLSGSERALRKRKIDQAYRQRTKKAKEDMQSNLGMLTEENESLNKENESLKKDNASMKDTLRDQEKEIGRLKSDLFQLKHEHEKQNVLVQTLSELLADPARLENERLKDENASLRKNAYLNNLTLLAEENAKLRTENKVLKVQNDALCGKIISDNEKKCEQEQ